MGLQREIVMMVTEREESEVGVSLGNVEFKQTRIEVDRTIEIGDFQMNVSEMWTAHTGSRRWLPHTPSAGDVDKHCL